LTLLADEPLKTLVAKAMFDVFGYEVVDLDEKTKPGEPKTLDLLLRKNGWSALVEVRSAGNRAARVGTDLEPMDDHAERIAQAYGQPTAKILVFNGLYRRPPEERAEEALFSRQVADEAQGRGITLLSTRRLLECIEGVRNGDITVDEFASALSRPGIFIPP